MRAVLCDAGNTRIRLLVLQQRRAVLRWAVAGRAAAMFEDLPDGVRVFAVAARGVLQEIGVAGRRVREVTARDFAGRMRCLYDVRWLGGDRAANAYAARDLFPGEATAVVSAGTCVTVDLVRADGVFAGGLILPGVRLALDAMRRGTAGLPHVGVPPTVPGIALSDRPIANTTRDAMRCGVVVALCSTVERFLRSTGARRLVVTGGDAGIIAAGVRGRVRPVIVVALALRGLALWLRDAGVLDDERFRAASAHPALQARVRPVSQRYPSAFSAWSDAGGAWRRSR